MSYAKEPLVIKPTREIPQEVMFNVKHAERDKSVPNRLWFRFPENWAHTNDKERIIGIRNIFVAQAERLLKITWVTSVYKKTDSSKKELLEVPFVVETYADRNDDFVKLLRYTYQWSDRVVQKLKEQYVDDKVLGPVTAAMKHYRLNLIYVDNKPTLRLHNDMNTDSSCAYGIKIKSIKIDDSALPILLTSGPTFNEDQTEVTMTLGWDRRPLYITSSISDITNDYYLGHSERTYTPIKYYRIHSTDDKFWVDTWSTRDHSIPSILPLDGKDDLLIEAIVCFDSSAMI